MRRRAPFVNNIYSWKPLYYDKACICSRTVYYVLLTIFYTVCHVLSLTFSILELSMVWKYNFFLTLVDFDGACWLLIRLKMWRNLVKHSLTSLEAKTGDQSTWLNAVLNSPLLNLLKSLYSSLSGNRVWSKLYKMLKTGRWSATSTAILYTRRW